MLVVGLKRGKTTCDSSCPWYSEEAEQPGYGGPLRTHCRMVMHPWWADCNKYDARCIEKIEVTEEEWKRMQLAIRKKAQRQRRLYPIHHKEIHPVGFGSKNNPSQAQEGRTEDK